jgi:uncharacterized membrane protein YedE/YeeE
MSRRPSNRALVVVGIALSLLIAGVLSWYASASPDGLQRVAEDQGFAQTSEDHAAADSPLADYGAKGVGDARLSGGLAGVIGVAATGLVMGGLVLVLRRRSGRTTPTDHDLPDDDR